MKRFIALLILVIPAIVAGYGVKLMRDTLFIQKASWIPSNTLQFIIGLLLFIFGLWFVGGFIFYRDRKQNKVQDRFKFKK